MNDHVDHFLLDRLEEFFGDVTDPWGVGFHESMIAHASPILARYPYFGAWSAVQHAGRIVHLMKTPADLTHPIAIDCRCNQGHVSPDPVIVDGWHRYFAHRELGSKVVPASFSGRVDLANYLSGKRKTRPR